MAGLKASANADVFAAMSTADEADDSYQQYASDECASVPSKESSCQVQHKPLSRRGVRHSTVDSSELGIRGLDLAGVTEADDDDREEVRTSQSCQVQSMRRGDDSETSSVIIFDWDDTLLPTWFISEVVKPCIGEGPVPEESAFYEVLASHAQIIRTTLEAAREVALVQIVTLAARPWVETSAQHYLPGLDLRDLLRGLGIRVYYARECIRGQNKVQAVDQRTEGVDLYMVAKRMAMVRCLRKLSFKPGAKWNVVSIGDSPAEHEALKEVLWSNDGDSLCKTVKLMDDPSIDVLGNELELLRKWFGRMISYEEDFDISLEDSNGDALAALS